MYFSKTLGVVVALWLLLFPTNTTHVPTNFTQTWEEVQAEFARQAFAYHLRIPGAGTWLEIEEYFTPEIREALSQRTNGEVSSDGPLPELLVRDALYTLRERHALAPDASWDEVIAKELEYIWMTNPNLLHFFRYRQLAERFEAFWHERTRELFPIEPIPAVPPRWGVFGTEGSEI